MIVTIDGPAGSGKSSTAKKVASKTGWFYLDSGSLYRTYTLLYLNFENTDTFLDAIENHKVQLFVQGNEVLTLLDGVDVGDSIRTHEVSQNVSLISSLAKVRDRVNLEMRRIITEHDFIADGRDLGSVVFPDAPLKFFMVADLNIRAERRYKELTDKGMQVSITEIKENLAKRDLMDSTRDIAPLIKPDNSIEIDTTKLSFNEQVEFIAKHIKMMKENL
jgi:cytidylate kinase